MCNTPRVTSPTPTEPVVKSVWQLPEDGAERLVRDGFFAGEGFLAPDMLAAVTAELAEWTNVPAINGYGCIFQHDDALLQNLGLYSRSALHLAVDERVLDFMERHYGEPALLTKCEYRRAVSTKEEMILHADGMDDVSIYVYLGGVSTARGATALMRGSQRIGIAENGGYLQIPLEVQAKHDFPLIEMAGGPGLCLFFNVNCWHKRTATQVPGREILWLAYSPLSRAENCVELVFARNSLFGLNDRQLAALGLKLPVFRGRRAEDFRMSRNLEPASLTFIPDRMLVKTLLHRNVQRLRAAVPKPVKRRIQRLLGLNRPAARKKIG